MSVPLKIVGAPGSPYSRKLRAVLRFRQIPHVWVQRGSEADRDTPKTKVEIMPVLVFPDPQGGLGEAVVDSTPLIRRLEAEYQGRSVIPPDPALAFLDALLEDYADEWVTKMMFHYRWAFEPDIAKAAAILPRWGRVDAPEDQQRALGERFAARQVGRLALVGSNEATAPVIEESYLRLLAVLDALLTEQPYLMGRRPGSSDFALFGQLTQLACFDPTSMALALEHAPRVLAWVDVLEDLSGSLVQNDQWCGAEVSAAQRALLCEVGNFYAPFLLANGAALARGEARVECEIDGRQWVQQAFPYQGKCLTWLREAYAALGAGDRNRVDANLAGTGCDALFLRPGAHS
jgi:glutathione S-transferase